MCRQFNDFDFFKYQSQTLFNVHDINMKVMTDFFEKEMQYSRAKITKFQLELFEKLGLVYMYFTDRHS